MRIVFVGDRCLGAIKDHECTNKAGALSAMISTRNKLGLNGIVYIYDPTTKSIF